MAHFSWVKKKHRSHINGNKRWRKSKSIHDWIEQRHRALLEKFNKEKQRKGGDLK